MAGWSAFHLLNNLGFANVSAVALALYSRLSPKPVASTIIGIYYLHMVGANLLVGWLGGLLDKMPATQFWSLHAALVAAATAVFLMVKIGLGRVLAPRPLEAEAAAAA